MANKNKKKRFRKKYSLNDRRKYYANVFEKEYLKGKDKQNQGIMDYALGYEYGSRTGSAYDPGQTDIFGRPFSSAKLKGSKAGAVAYCRVYNLKF